MSQYGWLSLLCLLTLSVEAGIYKSVGPDGRIIYSDRPQQGAEEVDLGPVQTYLPPPPSQLVPPVSKPVVEPEGYQEFAIVQPGDQETIWNNQGSLSVALSLRPAIKPGDEIQLVLDDSRVIAQGRTPAFDLQNIDRGTHRLHAIIVDETGHEVARSNTITFYLRRTIVRRAVPQGRGS